jgi:hypothetical protein
MEALPEASIVFAGPPFLVELLADTALADPFANDCLFSLPEQ